MGTAQVQGELWGAQARNWSGIQEKFSLPIYKIVFEKTHVTSGTRLLDVGCGSGLAVQLAAKLGADVAGIDASEALLAIARERVPPGDFRRGDLEELPYADGSFDVVTGFNSFQYASNPVHALMQARRVLKAGGYVAMATWGKAQDCEVAGPLAAVMAHLPPPPPGAEGPFALSAPGKLEALMEQAGFTPQASGDISGPFEYPDEETAWKGFQSSGPLVRAIREVGEEKIKRTVFDSFAPYKTTSGGYRMENSYRYIIARA
jgi:SAM-dependent methyltransferase